MRTQMCLLDRFLHKLHAEKFKCNWRDALFYVFIRTFLNACVIKYLFCSALNDTFLSLRHILTISSVRTTFTFFIMKIFLSNWLIRTFFVRTTFFWNFGTLARKKYTLPGHPFFSGLVSWKAVWIYLLIRLFNCTIIS